MFGGGGRDPTLSKGLGESRGALNRSIGVRRCAPGQGGRAGGALAPPAFPPSGPRPGDPTRSRSPRFQPGGREARRRRGEGRAGRGARGLPLVGGRLPGPAQLCAPHRLVPERAVLVDAAHPPRARPLCREPGPGPGAETSDSRGGSGKAAAPGVPGRDLKGPSLIPAPGPCALGGGIWEDPRLGS